MDNRHKRHFINAGNANEVNKSIVKGFYEQRMSNNGKRVLFP